MSWLSGWEPPRTRPAVRGKNGTMAGRSAALSGSGDKKHSWQHMLRYRAVYKQHVLLKTATLTVVDSASVHKPAAAPEVAIEGSHSLSTADGAS